MSTSIEKQLATSDASPPDSGDLENQHKQPGQVTYADEDDAATSGGQHAPLHQKLKSRHMQMIAIGGSIGAGLFVGSGSALRNGGPASVLLGFIIVGIMLLCTMQALGELAVLFPVNGAFYTYIVRFVDPSLGFAVGWDYAIGWLTVLPFELTAASITIEFWREDIRASVWITVFLVFVCVIQIFGVRGYGEVEFVLSMVKIIACLGWIILGIVINVGGVPGDDRGYIGGRYWRDPGAFQNGFKGFCTVFVTAAFAFGGTELVGLAAAEAANPRESLPTATRQVFWRIAFFYIVSLLLVGLDLPSDDTRLLGASGANTKASPFVLAIQTAGIKGLPSVFNAVITVSVISVANSCTYGSSRTMQALASRGMGPKFLTYVDKGGRPLWCLVIQFFFGCLAYIGEASSSGTIFTWLLALSGLSFFFLWWSINLSHIRFRAAWKYHGFRVEQLPYEAAFGVWGSWVGLILCSIAIIATFYTSLFPLGGSPDAEVFFSNYLAAAVVVVFYLFWKVWSRDWRLLVPIHETDVSHGLRRGSLEISQTPKVPAWKLALPSAAAFEVKTVPANHHVSPLTLVLDTLEQSGRRLVQEYLRRARLARTHTVFLAFETVDRLGFSLPAFLSSLLQTQSSSSTPSPSSSTVSLVAVYHSDVHLEAASGNYCHPSPLSLLKYLATTIITVHSLAVLLAEKAAQERSLAAPAFGLNEEAEGILVGLKHTIPAVKTLKAEERGIVLELEHRRKSGRGVHELYFLPTSSPATQSSSSKEKVILLDDHPRFRKELVDEQDQGEQLAGLTTFELGLTERQRLERDGVVLPYFDAQQVGAAGSGRASEGGRILYDMGVEDDFDEEEDEV
ncbi:hypothetical protein DV738_g3764, partial [Chaetothyriales sp. CBS 135597]